jgi:hypothetical protein
MNKLLAILLTGLILMSTIGISLVTHFCGGEQVKMQLAISNSKVDCGMNETCDLGDHIANSSGISETPCCKNHVQAFQIEENYKSEQQQTTEHIAIASIFLVVGLFKVNLSAHSPLNHFKYYQPPAPVKNLQALLQTFLN